MTDSVWPAPADSTVPDAGVYTKVPGTLAALYVAVAFSCVPLRAVGYVIADGAVQLMMGCALLTVRVVVVAVEVDRSVSPA